MREILIPTGRRVTREVMVGNVGVGGKNPIRTQSMTTTATHDIEATCEEIKKLYDVGCEIVRVTVQGKREAFACEGIKNRMEKMGLNLPLVADIHFYPPAAMQVIEFVDKVRINPGNYHDKRASFKVIEYTDNQYLKEIEQIEERFSPLVEKAKNLKKSLRIGTNHGSLSDRILNRYGDTPRGMVESAFEYARFCRKLDYHDIIFSMKASNPKVMIEAYRLLVTEMELLGWDYPIHLGVTEAGEGEDGRVKSAIGMGTLLMEGIGDTVRVSLTEDPWYEIEPCRQLVRLAEKYAESAERQKPLINRRAEIAAPLHRDGTVALIGEADGAKADFVIKKNTLPTLQTLKSRRFSAVTEPVDGVLIETRGNWQDLISIRPKWCLLSPLKQERLSFCRDFASFLSDNQLPIPILLHFDYKGDFEDVIIEASAECGSLLCDGVADGLALEGPYPKEKLSSLSFAILQGARMRSSKTEFISCPSCGRTLFHLQQVAERIRKKTGHLPGVKIGIMGCIVNGPGEMADADFGYVGSKTSKVDLYVGKTCVEKDIDHKDADDRLIALIKAHGRWIEPSV